MRRWKCTVCGYIHKGDEPPEKCPLCGADRSKFVEIEPEPEDALAGAATEEEDSSLSRLWDRVG